MPLCAIACATAPPAVSTNASTSAALQPGPPAQASLLGRIDPQFLQHLEDARELDHVKVGVNQSGDVWKLSIYHHDLRAAPDGALNLAPGANPQITMLESEWDYDGSHPTQLNTTDAHGESCETSSDPQGALRYRECDVALSSLPAAVQATVQNTVPSGQPVKAEKRDDVKGTLYEVEVQTGKRAHKLHVAADGTLKAHHIKVPAIFYYKVEVPQAG